MTRSRPRWPQRKTSPTPFSGLDRNTSSTRRRGSQQPQQPFTQACDEFFAGELSQLDNTFPAREAALVACVHLLRREQAHGQLLLTKRAVHADDLVRDRLAVYLRCLVLAHGATGGDVVSDAEATAAGDLLSVHMHAPSSGSDAEERIPPVWSLLSVVSNDVVRAYFPLWLVRMVLARSRYWQRLDTRLQTLRKQCRLQEAYCLVQGLCQVEELSPPARILLESFPERALWASWRPDVGRIGLWHDKREMMEPYIGHLREILTLEGPDTTGHMLPTLRHACNGSILDSRLPSPHDRGCILDHLLLALDRTLTLDASAIDLFVALCVDEKPPTWLSLEQLAAALSLNSPDATTKLLALVRQLLLPTTPPTLKDSKLPGQANDVIPRKVESRAYNQLAACADALPLLSSNPAVQSLFGFPLDLDHRLFDILANAQVILNVRLHDLAKDPCPFALGIQRLGHAMAESAWLRPCWRAEYHAMLLRMPPRAHVQTLCAELARVRRTTGPRQHQGAASMSDADAARARAIVETLRQTVGGAKPPPLASPGPTKTPTNTPPAITTTIRPEDIDPILSTPLSDPDLTALRDAFLRVAALDLAIAASCVRRARHESDLLVRELTEVLVAAAAADDQACCNVAALLGVRAAQGYAVAECWRRLLLHMMRARPRGLLERRTDDVRVSPAAWRGWVENLRRVLGERCLDRCGGGMGITEEGIRDCARRKLGVEGMDWESTAGSGDGGLGGGEKMGVSFFPLRGLEVERDRMKGTATSFGCKRVKLVEEIRRKRQPR